MKLIRYLLGLSLFLLAGQWVKADETAAESFNPQKSIFEHLGDEYGWNVWNLHIPLPVIVRDEEGAWHVFSSAKLAGGQEYEGFYIAGEGEYEGKVIARNASGHIYRPWDFSVTKNVLALFICALLLCWLVFPLVRWYKKKPYEAPRRVKGMMEFGVGMLYEELIVPILGKDARRFGPYLLTLFFFILLMNLMGLIVIFPGGANLAGNMSVTLVLAVCTFVVVNFSGRKGYWKDIFWPEVPTWLKCPVPMMPVIEIFGVFTKPIALMIRLFANMLGGHLITLVLISLIFIFAAMGPVIMGTSTVIAVVFAVFMGFIDLLICFIQAYVFMLLSAIFISLARPAETWARHEK